MRLRTMQASITFMPPMEVARRIQKSLLFAPRSPNVYYRERWSSILRRNFHRAPVCFPNASRERATCSTAYIAIGSNVGGTARLQMVEKAMEHMGHRLGKIEACSCLYETLPGYDIASGLQSDHNMYLPLFLNAVIQVISDVHDPHAFLSILQGIERECGRDRHLEVGNPNKPFERPVDLDLLLFKRPGEGFFQCKSDYLTLPHPRAATRNFVLFPLCDIDPFLVHPTEKLTVKELLMRLVERRKSKLSGGVNSSNREFHTHSGKNVPLYSLDGCLAIPRRCFTLDGKRLWTGRGFESAVDDTLRWIGEVKQRFEYDCKAADQCISGGAVDWEIKERIKTAGEKVNALSELESTLRSEPLVRIMGVLNVTPDSFSDGNMHFGSTESALKAAAEMRDLGADVIDIGGEATNPFVTADVSVEEECNRVVPVIEHIRRSLKDDVVLSVDTRRLGVAKAAVEAGANVVNDITAGESDHRILDFVASERISVVLMHSRGDPKTMDTLTVQRETVYPVSLEYKNVIVDVASSLRKSVEGLIRQGLPRWRILVDVGFGFAKCHEQCMELIRKVHELERWLPSGVPILFGYSRKRFVGWALRSESSQSPLSGTGTKGASRLGPAEIEDRDVAGTALACWAMTQKCGVALLRVHDVRRTALVRNVMQKIQSPPNPEGNLRNFDVQAVYPPPPDRAAERPEVPKEKPEASTWEKE